MSAFLGPIHHWLYQKIQLQEKLIQSILEAAGENHWDCVSIETLDARCGKLDLRPLEEIIDPRNIHGWLQQKIEVVELRLAFLVTDLLEKGKAKESDLEQIAYHFGLQHPVGSSLDPSRAYQELGDRLIDGMPCDHVNVIRESADNRLVWQQTKCVHQSYWEKMKGNVAVYYGLRAEMIKGMLSGSGLSLHTGENGLFELRKDECHV